MRIAGASSVAKSIFAVLTLLALVGSGDDAMAGAIVNPPLPQDELLLDLIVRNSRDPDLLTARQSAMQARLRKMGVDALEHRVRPDISTAGSSWMYERVRHDRWAPARVRTQRHWDPGSGMLLTWEISEGVLFTDSVDTNVAGVVVRTAPSSSQPGVRTRIDDVEQYLVWSSAVARNEALALQLKNRQAAQAGTGTCSTSPSRSGCPARWNGSSAKVRRRTSGSAGPSA